MVSLLDEQCCCRNECLCGGRWILSVVRYNVEAWAKHPGQVELRVKTFAQQRPVLNQYPQYSPLHLSGLYGADSTYPYVRQLSSPYDRPLAPSSSGRDVFSTRCLPPPPALKSSSFELWRVTQHSLIVMNGSNCI